MTIVLEQTTLNHLMRMLGVDKPEQIPNDLLKRVGRINRLIERAEPCGILASKQLLALLVDDWNIKPEEEGLW